MKGGRVSLSRAQTDLWDHGLCKVKQRDAPQPSQRDELAYSG
jgi:hypothetical protein